MKAKNRVPVVPVVAGAAALLALLGIVKLLQPPAATALPLRKIIDPPPLVDSRTAIDRQVLARPKSNLYKVAGGEPLADRKPKNFERFFVFAEQNGWIEVGDGKSAPVGWMKTEDTVDWPHSIVVEYGSPEKRYPVLYFRNEKDLAGLLESSEARKDHVEGLYKEIEGAASQGRTLPAAHPVICMEPGQAAKDLFINPVLESKFVEVEGRQGRMLRVTAAGLDRGATSFANPEYVKLLQASRQAEKQKGVEALEGIELDLVFVVDMTGSMQPWMDGLFAAISELAQVIERNPKVAGRVHLGLWGYQDNPGFAGIQFLTKNFTPSLLGTPEFTQVLKGMKVNKKTPDSYPEDVFSGVSDAIQKTRWVTKNRFLMVIGDAPGHTTVKVGGAKDIDAAQVRQIATDSGVQVVSLAVKDSSDPDYPKYHAPLEAQFRTLASNGNREPAYLSVSSSEQGVFKEMMDRLVGELAQQKTLLKPDEPVTNDPVLEIAKGLLESAKVKVVSQVVDSEGKSITPRDINGWVFDRDLINPDVPALEPKLLVNRTELNKLLITAEKLILEAEDAKIIGGDFFDAVLKAVAGSASGQRTDKLADRLPEFIKGLPYKSEFMSKSRDWWANASAQEVDRFITEMKAKLSYYRTVNESPALWKPLSREAASGDHVAAIPLSQLL